MNSIKSIDSKRCCGCMACVAACPQNAVSIRETINGFEVPIVDEELCISCGLCLKVCGIGKSDSLESYDQHFWAVKNKDDSIVRASSSGGVFYELAAETIRNGGVVFGASFTESFKSVKHIIIREIEDLPLLMGAKYVQSKIDSCFSVIAEDLKAGKDVLFSGTPCQVEAVINFLALKKICTKKLVTVDVICHGVPSPGIYQKYVTALEKRHHSSIQSYSFRDKSRGSLQGVKAVFKNSDEYQAKVTEDIFYKLFLYDYILRDSCYSCKYTRKERVADITIGDFWGYKGNIESKIGISLVFTNNQKGASLLKRVSDKFIMEETEFELAKQTPLVHPVKEPKCRKVVLNLCKKNLWKSIEFVTLITRIVNHFN